MLDFRNNELNGYCGFDGKKVSAMNSCPCICGEEGDNYCIGDFCDMYVAKGNDET